MANIKSGLQQVNEIDDYDVFEDEINEDEFFRPKKMNSWKSLAPFFISDILKKYTNPRRPMLQKDIMKKLEQEPYELSLERKAIGRVINVLCDCGFGFISKDKYGVYYDDRAKWYQ